MCSPAQTIIPEVRTLRVLTRIHLHHLTIHLQAAIRHPTPVLMELAAEMQGGVKNENQWIHV